MSQLIRMRQRIKAIKTIKKITHALRLISMSTHFRLRSRKNMTEEYKKELTTLFLRLYTRTKSWDHPLIYTKEHAQSNLAIVVGSQKGLCGNFNTQLLAFLERHKDSSLPIVYIAIGKKAVDYLKATDKIMVLRFNEFSMSSVESISRSITTHVLKNHAKYGKIDFFSNISKTFFVQKPTKTPLIPFSFNNLSSNQDEIPLHDYVWEQKPEEILDFLVEQYLSISIYELLFQSLIAEQAARFIAMDNSTRSAGTILETMQLQYNKMRQSKITGELTDLVGGFF